MPASPTGLWIPNSSVATRDGAHLELIGTGKEGQDFFRYRDRDLSFEFMVSCFDVNLEPTETWEVYLAHALKRYSSSQGIEVSAEEVRAIEDNIREAFLIAPRYLGQPAVKEVKFI